MNKPQQADTIEASSDLVKLKPKVSAWSIAALPPETDWHLYKERHMVECFFNQIKDFRRIALRCEKTISSFQAFLDLACAMASIS